MILGPTSSFLGLGYRILNMNHKKELITMEPYGSTQVELSGILAYTLGYL